MIKGKSAFNRVPLVKSEVASIYTKFSNSLASHRVRQLVKCFLTYLIVLTPMLTFLLEKVQHILIYTAYLKMNRLYTFTYLKILR